jgi:hypothetical protein
VRPSDFLLQISRGVRGAGTHGYSRAESARQFKLSVVHINRCNVQAHRPGVLDRHVAQSTDT